MPQAVNHACLASTYEARLASPWPAVHETRVRYPHESRWTERHLQCIWSDARLRPQRLVTADRESVEVEDPGRWNLEAGPDFLDATLRIGPERRRLVGDVEIHVRPADWTDHGHACDRNYARVIAHVTFFPGSGAPPGLPPHALRIALRDALQSVAGFAFEDIDLAAYPHAVIPPTPRPCAQALGTHPDAWRALLTSAGAYRIELKTRRMAARVEQTQSVAQVFYEDTLAALGYKRNQAAFRRIAQTLPLEAWSDELTPMQHYARLLGVAGLLPSPDAAADAAAQTLIRALWDAWWHAPAPAADPPIAWNLGATRPANHPARRLAAAAAMFAQPGVLWHAIGEVPVDDVVRWHARVAARLRAAAVLPCWEGRLTLTGPALPRAGALLGDARAAAIVANVVVPLLRARGQLPETVVATLPPEEIDAPMRATANRLFGRDHNPALYARDGLLQHGLLQIHADFCLNSRDGCRNCRLAGTLRAQDV